MDINKEEELNNSEITTEEVVKFSDLGISELVLKAIDDLGFEKPSQIQEKAIPVVLSGKDVIGQAQTGTGKTLAFGAGILSMIQPGQSKNPQAIILSPTRELASQIFDEFGRIGKYTKCSTICVFGGSDVDRQIRDLRRGVDIVVGTPGRVMDLMRRRALNLKDVQFVVLDEADEMLNMGFVEDIETILEDVNKERQTILFSATMPQAIKNIAANYMKSDHDHIAIAAKTRTATTVEQSFYEVRPSDRFEALCRLIDASNVSAGIIFCRTKRSVDEVTENMQKAGYSVEAMHGDLTQNHRTNTLRKFKSGTIKFLIATDVAARGIDVENVTHVVNYELPQDIESYIHRIGRTGRANKTGSAFSIITPREKSYLMQIQRVTKSVISQGELPTLSQIKDNRIQSLLSDAEEVIFAGNHKSFKSLVNEIDETRLLDFTAALFHMYYSDKPSYDYSREKLTTAPTRNKKSGKGGSGSRIFITVGSMDRVKEAQIVDFFVKTAGVKKEDVGSIDIKRKFSFVDLNPKVVDKVIKTCKNKKIKNRKVDIEVANGK